MDIAVDKLSIKNLLFSRAIPVHEISSDIQIEGCKIYPCTDCGDKFLFETSYENHINRRSVLITYMCRHCNGSKIFYNRCRLLQHIRSHSFKTATINVNDLRVEPVPLGMYKLPASRHPKNTPARAIDAQNQPKTNCFECKKILPSVGGGFKDRVAHLMQISNETYTCPVCLFALPTTCAFRAHLRLHLKFPPYYCPECGIHILNRSIHTTSHDCEGFNMMRATARVKCPVDHCHLLHPNESKDHMKERHVKRVFKCPICVVACFNEITMLNHLKTHDLRALSGKALIFYQCELCPGRLVLQNLIENHLRTHPFSNAYPCWTCGQVFKEVFALVDHQVKTHPDVPEAVKNIFISIVNDNENQQNKVKPKRIYRVIKRCDQCSRNFTYKCKYNEIPVLPSECPYKCTSKAQSNTPSENAESHIVCHLCNEKVPYNWPDIKKHYSTTHQNHRCLEPKLVINRMNMEKYMARNKKKIFKQSKKKKKRQVRQPSLNEQTAVEIQVPISDNQCGICGHVCNDTSSLETHLKTHRDPCMAYQCLECGKSFVVKPSFSKHLMLAHNIHDVEEYINKKECYNENALEKQQKIDLPMTPPKENQCTICMDQFDNAEDFEKHFRVHGMAFLLKNTSNNK